MWIAIVFAAIAPVYYLSKYQELTVKYQSVMFICGTQYTIQGAAYVNKHPNISKRDLVFDFAGKITDIWTEDSINRDRLLLGVIYSVRRIFGFGITDRTAGNQEGFITRASLNEIGTSNPHSVKKST